MKTLNFGDKCRQDKVTRDEKMRETNTERQRECKEKYVI